MPAAYEIQIADRQRALPIDRRWLRKVVRQTFAAEEVLQAELSLALVDDNEMRALHLEYLNHDTPTDVISFLLDCTEATVPARSPAKTSRKGAQQDAFSGSRPRGAGKILSGEVIVSTDTAIREAAGYQWEPQGELVLYIVHGILHLCGYDDLTPADLRTMRNREIELLALWNLRPPYTAAGAHAKLSGSRTRKT